MALATASLIALPSWAWNPGSGSDDLAVEPALLRRILADPGAPVDALVSVHGVVREEDLEYLSRAGLRTIRVFHDFGVVYAVAAGDALLRLSRDRVALVTENAALMPFLNTTTIAVRARHAWDDKSTSTNPVLANGEVVDGTGVGVAIVDVGIDGTHPDLAPGLVVNKRWLCPALTSLCSAVSELLARGPVSGCSDDFWADGPYTDTLGGHGTYFGGVVAGRGAASHGFYTGAAPGASLFGLGVGHAHIMFNVVEAMQWIHCNHATVSPPLRVVANPWGLLGRDFDPDDPVNRAVDALLADGIVVVFSAGNGGDDPGANTINTYAKNPTPGVLSVGAYDDDERGTRAGSAPSFTSCGLANEGNTSRWPDMAAPGILVTAPSATNRVNAVTVLSSPLASPFEANYLPYYVVASGTSASAGLVAGTAAMLLQAAPGLTPGEVEDVLEDHATAFSAPGSYVPDPLNPSTPTHRCVGHGLVDAIGSLGDPRVLNVSGLGSTVPPLSGETHVYVQTAGRGVDGQVAAAVQWTEPTGATVRLSERILRSGDASGFPLAPGQPARFRVLGPAGATDVPATIAAEGSGGTLRMDGPFAFPEPGAYVVESHVDFGGGFVAFDAFGVHAVGPEPLATGTLPTAADAGVAGGMDVPGAVGVVMDSHVCDLSCMERVTQQLSRAVD